MSSWHSYPSIYNIGHRAVKALFDVPVLVEEKIDGSQFSFGAFPSGSDSLSPGDFTKLRVRSKGAVMLADAPEKMFSKGVEVIKERQHLLREGWTYRGEYLQKPKHNTLAYDRIPQGHVIIFDINTEEEAYLSWDEKAAEATRLGFEVVPRLYEGYIRTADELRRFLDNLSILGGQTIEGVVIKQLGPNFLYGPDHKALIGKFVSERFKEAHGVSWKELNPTAGGILQTLGESYGVPGRWLKAIQHLREAGQLEDNPRDIGKLVIAIQKDTEQECKEEIQKHLWKWAWPHVSRAIVRGFPEYYKQHLLSKQFDAGSANGTVTEGGNNVDGATIRGGVLSVSTVGNISQESEDLSGREEHHGH